MEQVYYDDGTKTTLNEVMPMVMQRKLMPYMFVDADGNYKMLVVQALKKEPLTAQINYEGMPVHLKGLGYSFGNPESEDRYPPYPNWSNHEFVNRRFQGHFYQCGRN